MQFENSFKIEQMIWEKNGKSLLEEIFMSVLDPLVCPVQGSKNETKKRGYHWMPNSHTYIRAILYAFSVLFEGKMTRSPICVNPIS